MQYKLLPPSYALCIVTDWLAFNRCEVMCVCVCVCVSLYGRASVGVRVGGCACEVCVCVRVFASMVLYKD